MNQRHRQLERLLRRRAIRRVAIAGALALAMMLGGGVLALLTEPSVVEETMVGEVLQYRVFQGSGAGLNGASVPYWVVDVGGGSPVVVREPPGREFEKGGIVCIEMWSGTLTGRYRYRVTDPSECVV